MGPLLLLVWGRCSGGSIFFLIIVAQFTNICGGHWWGRNNKNNYGPLQKVEVLQLAGIQEQPKKASVASILERREYYSLLTTFQYSTTYITLLFIPKTFY